MIWIGLSLYGFICYCLSLGILLRPESVKNDHADSLSIWLLGLTIGSAIIFWPITFIIFSIVRLKKNKKNGIITMEDEDLFFDGDWTENSGIGRVVKPDLQGKMKPLAKRPPEEPSQETPQE